MLALGLILLGVVVFLGTAVGGLWTWTNFMASGVGITVPCTVEIDLEETGKDMVVWRGSPVHTSHPIARSTIHRRTWILRSSIDKQTSPSKRTRTSGVYSKR